MRILLVEDNILIGDAVRDHLTAEGWAVEWVLDLGSAMMIIDEVHYSLVLLDLHLPDGTGLTLLKKLQFGSPETPVVILSAFDQISDRIDGLRRGAVDYLVKPFNLDEMIARIRCLTTSDAVASRNMRALKTRKNCVR